MNSNTNTGGNIDGSLAGNIGGNVGRNSSGNVDGKTSTNQSVQTPDESMNSLGLDNIDIGYPDTFGQTLEIYYKNYNLTFILIAVIVAIGLLSKLNTNDGIKKRSK